MFSRRINIFAGHFGSGKTEVAVNFALKLSKEYKNTAIVDLDIVNPYFRTVDARDDLEQNGIWVIAPVYANTNVDVPALPAEINTLFEKKEYKVVFDVGGDDLGAKAVSRYKDEIVQDDYEIYFVINTKRPMTNNADRIKEMIWEIEESAGLKITSLVNNTNLLGSTTSKDILEGHELIEQVSLELNIPIGFISGMKNALDQSIQQLGFPLLQLEKHIKLPWE
ncbi:MAG TPA: MinD/ParA family protein [Clostridiaceae bacterium]|nr:MinD/ParA family protein [Clostridiaceae bacterium]